MKQHVKIIEKGEEKSSSEIVQHHQKKRYQCMFNPRNAFIVDNEIDYKKRKIKEAIYSIINDSINRHDQLDESWYPVLQHEKNKIKRKIKYKKQIFQNKNI